MKAMKSIGTRMKKHFGKAKDKAVDYAEKKIHDKKKDIALDVIDSTMDKVASKQKMHLKASEELIEDKFAKGKGIYSSDEMFVLNVYNKKDELLGSKNFRARNQKEANEIAEGDYESEMKNKFGTDLRFEVKLAPSIMAKGKTLKGKKKWIKPALSGKKGIVSKFAEKKGIIKEGKDLTLTSIRKVEKVSTGKMKKRAIMAETLIGFNKKRFGEEGMNVSTPKGRVIDYYIQNSDNEDLISLMGVSDMPNLKQMAEKWVNNRDSYYHKIYNAIDGIHNRTWGENKFVELGLEEYANGSTVEGTPIEQMIKRATNEKYVTFIIHSLEEIGFTNSEAVETCQEFNKEIIKYKEELVYPSDVAQKLKEKDNDKYAEGSTMENKKYKVVKIFRKSGRREILFKNLSKDEAMRTVNRYPSSNTSMVVFYEMFKTGGRIEDDFYEVYDEESGMSLLIQAVDQDDADSIAEDLDFNAFEDGDEVPYNWDEEYANGGGLKSIPKGNKGLPKLPESVRNKMGYMENGGYIENPTNEEVATNGEVISSDAIIEYNGKTYLIPLGIVKNSVLWTKAKAKIYEEEFRTGGVAGSKHVSVTKGYRLPHGYKAVKGSDKSYTYSKGHKGVKVDAGWRLPKGYEVVDGAYDMKYEHGTTLGDCWSCKLNSNEKEFACSVYNRMITGHPFCNEETLKNCDKKHLLSAIEKNMNAFSSEGKKLATSIVEKIK